MATKENTKCALTGTAPGAAHPSGESDALTPSGRSCRPGGGGGGGDDIDDNEDDSGRPTAALRSEACHILALGHACCRSVSTLNVRCRIFSARGAIAGHTECLL